MYTLTVYSSFFSNGFGQQWTEHIAEGDYETLCILAETEANEPLLFAKVGNMFVAAKTAAAEQHLYVIE